ncbi:MAG: rRNA maturation RNase YbeY [Gammaproteobacteria bacterium RIFCSPLOWO2_02_FULL_52_10]|nr:MAG: rRNA maturation RNase YbeY [Gammaproteobacteria bacterium RIFCSPLOWO2_02_FULL_52_10]
MAGTSKITVEVQIACKDQDIPTAARIRNWVKMSLKGLRKRAELTVRIVNKSEGTKLNEYWRNRKGPTNVLAFPAGGQQQMPELLGDIVICAPVVKKEAIQQHKVLTAHWAHMVVHGVLHLLGFEHDEKQTAAIMEAMEIRILHDLGFANPYN